MTQEKWATFFLCGEMFSIQVKDVQEVLVPQTLTPVPLAPAHLVGLLNLRGQIIPALDLRRFFGFPARELPGNLMVLKFDDQLLSIVVDEIGDVLELDTEGWRSPPDTLDASHRRFVSRIFPIEGHVVLSVNTRVFTDEAEHDENTRAA